MKTEREFIEGIYRKAEIQRQQEALAAGTQAENAASSWAASMQAENAARGGWAGADRVSGRARSGRKVSGRVRYSRAAGTVVLAAACLMLVYLGGRSFIMEKPGTATQEMSLQGLESQGGEVQSGDTLTGNEAQEALNGELNGTQAAAPYSVAPADADTGVGLESRIVPGPQEYELAVEVIEAVENADGMTNDAAGGTALDEDSTGDADAANDMASVVVVRYLVLESADGLAEAGEEIEISLAAADYEFCYPDGAALGERQILTVYEGENGLVLAGLTKMEETSEHSEAGK